MLRGRCAYVGLAKGPQLLLERMLLCHAKLLLLAWRQGGVHSLFGPGDGLFIERFDLFGPLPEVLVAGEIVFQLMHISQEVDPASLMHPLMHVVAPIKIASQHALEVLSNHLLDDLSASRVVVFVVADRRCADTPDVAILAILSPSGFIGLHCGATANACFQAVELWLGKGFDAVEQVHQFPQADLEAM